MLAKQHTWVVEVLRDIVDYAEKFDLKDLHDHCQGAYDAAVDEVGNLPSSTERVDKQKHFIDAIRELIDYAEKENLVNTGYFLLHALRSATHHWDHPKLASTVIRFPRREES
jgi:hypothetical protein